ncbi:MAG: HlyD family secretion protein [Ruegeria sp.]
MIVFLTLCYCAVLFLLVKLRIIPANTFWKLSPALWIVALFAGLFVPMQWGAPSGPVRIYESVVEIIPNVSGEVVDVPVEPNVPLKKGDVLFMIDPTPYKAVVDQKRAELAAARQAVPQLKAAFDAAMAAVDQARATRDRAKADYDRYKTANVDAASLDSRSLPFSVSDIEHKRLSFVASEAALTRTQAVAEQAKLAYSSQINGVNTKVAELEAELVKAEFELSQTTVRAPSDGYVVGVTLQTGQRVANLPLRSWIAFVPSASRKITVAIPQTRLRYVQPGQDAEVAFAFLPGEVITAKVKDVIQINAGAQLPPSGILPSVNTLEGPNELMAVTLDLNNPAAASLPGGADGTAAVYTQAAKSTHVVRKVMLRMDAWMNYILPN